MNAVLWPHLGSSPGKKQTRCSPCDAAVEETPWSATRSQVNIHEEQTKGNRGKQKEGKWFPVSTGAARTLSLTPGALEGGPPKLLLPISRHQINQGNENLKHGKRLSLRKSCSNSLSCYPQGHSPGSVSLLR